MILGLFRPAPAPSPVEALYGRVAAGSRQPGLYLTLGVADTPEGRFEALVLHAALLLRRLGELPAPAEDVAQDFVDILFRELDRALRELGVGDLSVAKKIKKLAKAFYGRAESYRTALQSGDQSALALALGRNLLDGEGPAPQPLVAYVLACDARLASLSLDDMFRGAVLFEDLP